MGKFRDVYFFEKEHSICCFVSLDRMLEGMWYGLRIVAVYLWKLRPGFDAQNGMHFPVEASEESASQNSGSERDTLSGWHVWRKLRPSFWLQNGIHFPERSTCGGVPTLLRAPLVELRYS